MSFNLWFWVDVPKHLEEKYVEWTWAANNCPIEEQVLFNQFERKRKKTSRKTTQNQEY